MSNVKHAPDSSHSGGTAEPGGSLLAHLWSSISATIILGVIVCGIYPLIVYGLGQLLFPVQANGSLIKKDGTYTTNDSQAVGSALIGQNFSAPQYFHPRPGAAGAGYDATSSGGSNLGPLSAKLLHGTTKTAAYTVFASKDKDHVVAPMSGRIQGYVTHVTRTSITLGAPPATVPATASTAATPTDPAKTTYALDAAVADSNAVVNFHGRTIHATTIPLGSIVELTLNDKTPAAVTGINVADGENDAAIAAIDTVNNKLTLDDTAATVVNLLPNTVFIVAGRKATLSDLAVGMSVHVVASTQVDFDGIADRVIQYCQANSIKYTSSIKDTDFKDADGVDDVRLITAFNAASSDDSSPTITPETPLPADAVTASASGLDPHISPQNARLQAQRVVDARNDGKADKDKIGKDAVLKLIDQYTDQPNLGVLGDPGVNVLRLNLALDAAAPMPAAAPPSTPAATAANAETRPATAPATTR